MDGKIALQVNKLIVHKRIHEYLKALSQQKPETKEENANQEGNRRERSKKEGHLEEGEVK